MNKFMTFGIMAISLNLGLSAVDAVYMGNGQSGNIHNQMIARPLPANTPTVEQVIEQQQEHHMLGKDGAGTRQMMGSDPATWSPNSKMHNNGESMDMTPNDLINVKE